MTYSQRLTTGTLAELPYRLVRTTWGFMAWTHGAAGMATTKLAEAHFPVLPIGGVCDDSSTLDRVFARLDSEARRMLAAPIPEPAPVA